MSKRLRFSRELKVKFALEALRGDRTLQAIAARHQVHPNQIGAWKRQAMEGLAEVFSGVRPASPAVRPALRPPPDRRFPPRKPACRSADAR